MSDPERDTLATLASLALTSTPPRGGTVVQRWYTAQAVADAQGERITQTREFLSALRRKSYVESFADGDEADREYCLSFAGLRALLNE